jgi:hypothetical protein
VCSKRSKSSIDGDRKSVVSIKSKFSEQSTIKIMQLEDELDKEKREREKLLKIIEDLRTKKQTIDDEIKGDLTKVNQKSKAP